LQDILFCDIITNEALFDTDASFFEAISVSVSEFCDNVNWAQSCVFCKSIRNNLKRISKSREDSAFGSLNLSGLFGQLLRDFDFWGSASGYEASVFDQASYDAKGVMNGSLGFIDDLSDKLDKFTKLLDALTRIVTVFAWLCTPLILKIILSSSSLTSSAMEALPNLSSFK
jgi:hypothetical protein